MITTKDIRNNRLEICKSCPYFVSSTLSCGELIKGGNVVQGRTTRKLCGCVMPTKTWLKIAKCPLNKWGRELSRKDLKKIKDLIHEVRTDIRNERELRVISKENKKKLYDIIETKEPCGCNGASKRKIIEDFMNLEKQYEERNR